MKIVQVNKYTAPARDSQGTQRVLESLSKELVRQGHEVSLLINPDSVVSSEYGKLVKEIPEDAEIVHFHGGFPEEYGYSRYEGKRWISTVHGGGQDSPSDIAEKKEWLDNLVFVSNFCSNLCDSKCYIHNCVSDEDFIYREKKDDYFLWMAGTDWGEQKGLFSSIMLAKKLGFKLKIAGSGRDANVINQIKSLCNDKIEYLGSINGKLKAEVLAGAKGLLMIGDILDACPVNVLESFASGTPVIAKNKGSHTEIVKSNVGYVCDTPAQIVKAILNIDKIKTSDCRKYYLENFTPQVVVEKYLSVYRNIIEYNSVFGKKT